MPKEKLKSRSFGIDLQCWNSNWSYFCLLGFREKQTSNSTSSSIKAIASWFFAPDHLNYSRHRNAGNRMQSSSHRVSATEGNFVIKKTHCNFSAIPIDHAHEQKNKIIKGEGGFIMFQRKTTHNCCPGWLHGQKLQQQLKNSNSLKNYCRFLLS